MSITTATLNGAATSVSDAAIDAFRGSIRGELVLSDSPSYETARRVWNGNIDRRPALIVRCTGPADVQRAVDFARTHELLLSLRGGGHSAPGYGTNDGGMVIDLSPMKGIRVDRRQPHGTGARWRPLERVRSRDTGVRARHHGRDGLRIPASPASPSAAASAG